MADDVARDAQRGLVPVPVSGQRLHLLLGEERRVAQGHFPFVPEQVAGLDVEALPAVHEGIPVAVEQRFVAGAPHIIGVERESAVFEDEVGEVGAYVACGVVGHDSAALAFQARSLVVVGVGPGEQDAGAFLEVEIPFQQVALGREAPQRVEFQTPRVGHPSVRRAAPVAAFAERHGAFGREVEAALAVEVVLAEEPEVAVEVEFAVDDAAIDELQGARRVDPCAVGLDLGLSEPDVPFGARDVVDDGVAHDVHVPVGQHLGVVAGESQLDRVDQLGRIDVAVEPQAEPFHAGVGLGEGEIVVERQRQQVLHPETHRQFEPFVFGPEGDALAHLDVGHVAQLLDQFVGRVGRNDFGLRLDGSGLRLPGCGRRPAGGEQEEQDR